MLELCHRNHRSATGDQCECKNQNQDLHDPSLHVRMTFPRRFLCYAFRRVLGVEAVLSWKLRFRNESRLAFWQQHRLEGLRADPACCGNKTTT